MDRLPLSVVAERPHGTQSDESCLTCGRPGYEHSCPAQSPGWRRRVTPIEPRLTTLLCLARIRGRRSRRQPLFNHTSLGGGFQNDGFQTIVLTILTMISDHALAMLMASACDAYRPTRPLQYPPPPRAAVCV